MALTKTEISIRDREVCNYVKKHGRTLCHYTSLTALHGILKDKEFWLGSTASMNDKSEINLFINQLKDSLSEYKSNKHYKSIFRQLNKLLTDKDNYPFAMALSKLEDNAAQWERYADDAKGCCIVFNTTSLRKTLSYSGMFFDEVFYDYDIRSHAHYKALKYYFETGEFDGNPILSGFTNEPSWVSNIYLCSFARKHKSFCTEEEYRISTPYYKKHGIKNSKVENVLINGIVRRILKINMYDMCVEAGTNFEDLFEQIILGPRKEQSVFELQAFIRDLTDCRGLANKIIISKCPLR